MPPGVTVRVVTTDIPHSPWSGYSNGHEDHNDGFFDASIWESAKKTGDVALKQMISGGLESTSVTAVLIGSKTYASRWVHYEMMKSTKCGN